MRNVFMKVSAEQHIQLSDGRMMPLEDLVRDYERLLKEKAIISEPKDEKAIKVLKVGQWFRIDREAINKRKEEIRHECEKVGKGIWERFESSNKIANENPERYPRLIETYIFEKRWNYKTIGEMWYMCEDIGEMCDEVICDLELQMRICNGESVEDLFERNDKLPYRRVIKCKYEDVCDLGYVGGGTEDDFYAPPARLATDYFDPYFQEYYCVPYAFRGLS